MDILPSDLINSYIFTFDDNDEPINPYFDIVGVSYHNSIRNMGSTFIFMVANLGLLLVIGVSKIFGMQKVYSFLEKKFMWNHFLRFLLQQYVTLYLASMVNLYSIDKTFNGETSALSFSFPILFLSALTPIFFYSLVYLKQTNRLSSTYFDSKLSSLIEGLSYPYWNALSLFKWTLTLTILVTLSDIPCAQITLLYTLSVVYQGLLLNLKPFSDPVDNYLSFFNEYLISLTVLLFLISSDLVDDYQDLKKWIGYLLIGVLFASVVVNLGAFTIRVVIQTVKTVYKTIMQYRL